jgi:pyruvate/2-oxoacid:ferredoxin oxidoreductase beta subunit
MNRIYLNDGDLPFCKGCGHSQIALNTDIALQKLNIPLLNVIFVTDIGCHGIIDSCLKTHTVHGLHGRSVALASGISAGLDDINKKVIVFIGDGGATIGLQHIIDAAHNNFNMTVVLHNNMLYGMTGGQPSELTPCGFKTPTHPDGVMGEGYDICSIVNAAGAVYARRILGIGDFSDALAESFSKKGFSIIEVMEICPSYGIKSNPGMKLKDISEKAGLPLKTYVNSDKNPYKVYPKPEQDLIKSLPPVEMKYKADAISPVKIMISGSASEGIQLAAEFFSRAAAASGLFVSKKGSYPVTVGIGFSSSDIIISPSPILFTGSPKPDVLIITSADGLAFSANTLANMDNGLVFIDDSLLLPDAKINFIKHPFRQYATPKNSALYALLYYLKYSGIFNPSALLDIINSSKIAQKFNFNNLPLPS